MPWFLALAISAAWVAIDLVGAALMARPRLDVDFSDQLAIRALAGTLGVYVLALAAPDFVWAAAGIVALASVGAIRTALAIADGGRARRNDAMRSAAPLAVYLVPALLVLAVTILFTPLSSWDARSIWFFHAKMLASIGGFAADPYWASPEIAYSAVGHPKLLPAAGAVFPAIFGVWNEFVPKAGLLLLAFPLLAALAGFARGRAEGLVFGVALVLACFGLLTNGLADGYHGAFAALGTASLLHAATGENAAPGDAMRGILCFGIALSLKVEAMPALAVCGASVVAAFAMARRPWPAFDRATAAMACLAASAPILWIARRIAWGLGETVHVNFDGAWPSRAIASVERWPEVASALWGASGVWRYAVVAALAIAIAAAVRRRPPAAALWRVAAANLYLLVISVLYLGTTADLRWLIAVTFDRTPTFASLTLLLAAWLAFDKATLTPSVRA
jgi:hypothetical protein